jgi:hypothetical protein
MSASEQLVPQRGQELECRLAVGMQGRLAFHPRLGVREGLEDAAPTSNGSIDDPSIDEKQENNRSLLQRHDRPVCRFGQVVFQMQPRVPDGFLEQSGKMFVILVRAVMSEFTNPQLRQLSDE